MLLMTALKLQLRPHILVTYSAGWRGDPTPLMGGTVAERAPGRDEGPPSHLPYPLPLMALTTATGRRRGRSMVVLLWAMRCPVADDRASVSREKK